MGEQIAPQIVPVRVEHGRQPAKNATLLHVARLLARSLRSDVLFDWGVFPAAAT
jgi:hypothetical protein